MSKISATNRFETSLNLPMDWHEADHHATKNSLKKAKLVKKNKYFG
jgi:hypothetical protein